ncbi:unnamed protein product, partial [Symbiodinium microadriaticum]
MGPKWGKTETKWGQNGDKMVLTFIIEDLAAASERLLSRGQQMSDEAKRVRVVERPEKATIRAFVDCPGTGKTTMLKSLFAEYHDGGRWVLPVSQDIGPRSQLDLTDVVQWALSTQNSPQFLPEKFNMSELVVVDPLPLKSVLALLCMFFVLPLPFGVAVWANRAISLFRGFVELALETPEIASNLNMDKLSQEEVLKYFYLRASGSFREL